jgi:hypothetical protein
MTITPKITKVAVIRAEGYPIGVTAPVYLNCPCGARPQPSEYAEVVCKCGRRYTASGWLRSGPDIPASAL